MAWQEREEEWAILQETQRCLGEICMLWAAIDRQLDNIIMMLLGISPEQTAIITSTVREIPPRCTMIQRLLLCVETDERWAAWLHDEMKLLRDDLAVKRNRYVHDRWIISTPAMTKIDRRAQTPKPQSRQRPEVRFDTEETVSIDELKEWWRRGFESYNGLTIAIDDLRVWRLSQDPIDYTTEDKSVREEV